MKKTLKVKRDVRHHHTITHKTPFTPIQIQFPCCVDFVASPGMGMANLWERRRALVGRLLGFIGNTNATCCWLRGCATFSTA
jgi:hypothetical protein